MGNDLTVRTGAMITYATRAGWGQVGVFNGTTDLAVTTLITLAAGTPRTLEGWFKASSLLGGVPMIIMGSGAAAAWYIGLLNTSGRLYATFNAYSQNITSTVGINLANDAFHHWALVYNGTGNTKLYLDGVETGTATNGAAYSITINNIGTVNNTNTYHWVGSLGEMLVWNYVRYTGNFTPPTAPAPNTDINLLYKWSLNGNILDNSIPYIGITSGAVTRYSRALDGTAQVIQAAPTTNGTPAYSMQWQRAPDVAGAPGAYVSVGALQVGVGSGVTPTALSDTGLTPNTGYWYRQLITDAIGSTAYTTVPFYARTIRVGARIFGWIGDSIVRCYGYIRPTETASVMSARMIGGGLPAGSVEAWNYGVDSARSVDWAAGQSLCNAMINSCRANAITDVMICLGMNDAKVATIVTPAAYRANILGTCNALLNAGVGVQRIWLNRPPWASSAGYDDPTLRLYWAEIDAICNGTTIMRGDTDFYETTKLSGTGIPAMLQVDGVHPTDEAGTIWAHLVTKAVGRMGLDGRGGRAPMRRGRG